MCTVNGEIPNRIILDHKNEHLLDSVGSLSTVQSQFKSDQQIRRPNVVEDFMSDAVRTGKLVDTVTYQMRYLKNAVEHSSSSPLFSAIQIQLSSKFAIVSNFVAFLLASI